MVDRALLFLTLTWAQCTASHMAPQHQGVASNPKTKQNKNYNQVLPIPLFWRDLSHTWWCSGFIKLLQGLCSRIPLGGIQEKCGGLKREPVTCKTAVLSQCLYTAEGHNTAWNPYLPPTPGPVLEQLQD